jgi:hypothetical protein
MAVLTNIPLQSTALIFEPGTYNLREIHGLPVRIFMQGAVDAGAPSVGIDFRIIRIEGFGAGADSLTPDHWLKLALLQTDLAQMGEKQSLVYNHSGS